LAAGVALLALVAGCGGGSTESGDSPTGDSTETTSSAPQINDPAVEAAALRTVDSCALLTPEMLGEVGTVVPDSVSAYEWGECRVDVSDASGKTVEMVLHVGDGLVIVDDPTEELEGLPLIVDDDDAPKSCWVSVVTSYEQSLGITFQVDYADGDACEAGQKALTKVVQTIHTNPPQHEQAAGSVLTADPCAVADKKAVETALGDKAFVDTTNLHECNLWSGDGTSYPQVSVRFFLGLPPEEGKPVDLGGGVSAMQKEEEDLTVSCDVSYRKIETPSEDQADGYGEIVSVAFSGEPESGLDTATACEKAVAVAKTVVPSLGT
jgi:hypothetical protein